MLTVTDEKTHPSTGLKDRKKSHQQSLLFCCMSNGLLLTIDWHIQRKMRNGKEINNKVLKEILMWVVYITVFIVIH